MMCGALWSKSLCHPPKLECSNSNTNCTLSRWGTSSMSENIQSVKSIGDNLAAVANPVADSDLVSTLLSSLSPEYDSSVTSINTRVNLVLPEELIGLMYSQEIYRGSAITSSASTTFISPSLAIHTASRTQSYHSTPSFFRGRGRGVKSPRGGVNRWWLI